MKYLSAFSEISGLKCNISKTKVIPIGDFDLENRLCQDIKLEWESDFILLKFYIDNMLEKLKTNLYNINKKLPN